MQKYDLIIIGGGAGAFADIKTNEILKINGQERGWDIYEDLYA